MELRTTVVAVLVAVLGVVPSVAAGPPAAPATVHNHCGHPTYAPGGTNRPVVMAGPGFAVTLPCGRSAGNVYSVRTLHPTRIVESDGSNVCWRAGNDAPLQTGSARVYTVSRC